MPTYAFVNQIAASPTVLLDLDDQSPFSVVEGTKTPPPQRRFSSFGSSARDGDTIAASSYADRVLTIELGLNERNTPEQQVEAIQKLGRLLGQPQWLMWQHDGQIEPVFFRTRPGDADIDDEFMTTNTPTRSITLTILAEYASYGLPVTGTATINNDPTAGTNPMSLAMPAIQGDVAAPLGLVITASTSTINNWPCVLASSATPTAQSGPLLYPTNVFMIGANFNPTTFSDSTAVGGSTLRVTRTTGSNVTNFKQTMNVPTGVYRVLVRSRASDATTTLRLGAAPGGGSSNLPTNYGPTRTLTSAWRWFDMGVFRLPFAQPRSTPLAANPLPATNPATLGFQGVVPNATNGSIDIDSVVLVPSGRDDAVDTRFALTSSVDPTAGVGAVFDSLADVAYCSITKGDTPILVAGALPRVVPGVSNFITFVRQLGVDDDKAVTTTLTWVYYPRYLYTRPATS